MTVRWIVLPAIPLGIALVLSAGCDGESGLGPGSSTFLGNVSSAMTAGDGSLGGIVVAVSGDGVSTGITDAAGDFRISATPTGNVFVAFRRGACEAGFPLDAVPSRSTIRLTDVDFDCDTAIPGTILESFQAVLRDRPGSPDDLDTCIRAGRDDRRRNVDGSAAGYELADGRPANFFDLDDDDRLGIDGERTRTGAPGTLLASRIRILERNVNDPCDDDPFE
jgi:hypothetical protein